MGRRGPWSQHGVPTNLVLWENLPTTCIWLPAPQGERQQYGSLKDQADKGHLQATASEVPNKMLEISHVTSPVGPHEAHSHWYFVRHERGKEDGSSALLLLFLIIWGRRMCPYLLLPVSADQRRCIPIQISYSVLRAIFLYHISREVENQGFHKHRSTQDFPLGQIDCGWSKGE